MITRKLLFFFCWIYLTNSSVFGQNLEAMEQQLEVSLNALRSAKTDDEILQKNELFKKEMETFLKKEGAFKYKFTKLTTVADLQSEDQLVRIVHWNLEFTDFSYSYAGFVMRWNEDNEQVQLTELVDHREAFEPIPDNVIDAKNWYGALYYKIIPVEYLNEIQYVLLGWDGATTMSNFKVIDVMSFKGNAVKLGSPLFVTHKKTLKRVVFEYSDKSDMALRMDQKRNRIVFDHLSPESPSLSGIFSFYVPDFSYDAYVWDEDHFILKEDVIATNDEGNTRSGTVYVMDPKTLKPKKQNVRLNWINPEGKKSSSDISHVARTEDTETTTVESPEPTIPKKKWWDRRNPDKLSVTTGRYKKNRRKPPKP